jgi:hypothetical protein
VKQVRIRRGITVPELAERCAAIGAPHLTAQSIYKIEGQRESSTRPPRRVTVDELLILAIALNVAPVNLLVPPDDSDTPYPLTSRITARRFSVRAWIRGVGPIDPDASLREFYTEVPEGEFYTPAHTDSSGEFIGAVQQGPPRPRQEESDSS